MFESSSSESEARQNFRVETSNPLAPLLAALSFNTGGAQGLKLRFRQTVPRITLNQEKTSKKSYCELFSVYFVTFFVNLKYFVIEK